MTTPRQDPRPVLVVDLGAQYAQLIARRIRECHVYSEIVPFDLSPREIAARRPAGIVLSGGPASVYDDGAPSVDPGLFALGVPVLGICYGHQLMARALGGEVAATGQREYGGTELRVLEPGVLLQDLATQEQVWMSHGDAVTRAPDGFRVTSRTEQIGVASMEDPERGLFAVQFHPEVAHTPRGTAIMKRFLYDGCGLLPDWTPANVIERSVAAIRAQVGDAEVLCALSGGVDSAVAALLVHRAVGDQLTCVFVDTGLLREGEPEQVEETFGRHFLVPLVHVKAEDRFLARLEGVTDPEDKRKRICEEFIRVFEEVAREHRGARFLVQGTLYPDVIESGSTTAATIKSHHNVGGLPKDMDLELVEPLRDLFKDEVRSVGAELGLPEEIVQRQPFPGPGLAVRIVGEVTAENLHVVRAADHVVTEEIRRAGLDRETWQAFCVLLADVRSVGVMGDGRTYQHPIVLRAVTSEDAMTADWARLPHEVLDRISSRVIREV
ncbi:MAG: glutamine-hydrolyzing GMP synthase, partial [Actinomycetota bacterium]